MPTKKQIAANRRNAQKSTGPRTAEGKTRSSLNALRSGIDAKSQVIYNETYGDLEWLKNDYHDRFCPTTPEQRMLVDTLTDCEWLLRRFRRIEAQLWEQGMNHTVHSSILGEAYQKTADAFARLQRRIDATQPNYRQALHELERLQAAESAEIEPEPASEPAVTSCVQTSNGENGFVPQPVSAIPPESAQAHPLQPQLSC